MSGQINVSADRIAYLLGMTILEKEAALAELRATQAELASVKQELAETTSQPEQPGE
jgi:hypothetical protein